MLQVSYLYMMAMDQIKSSYRIASSLSILSKLIILYILN